MTKPALTDILPDPKSLQGHLLLHRTTFNTGAHYPTSSRLLSLAPSPGSSEAARTNGNATNGNAEPAQEAHALLLASPTGVLATLRPLSESGYRRLYSIALQLTASLAYPAGLNPRAHRMASASCGPSGVDAGIGRSIVDGAVLERFMELGTGKRGEIAGRAGYGSAAEVRAELEALLGWAGMGYF